ncbi:MAG: tryptophan--tRNA ligase [Mycoplasmatales bacterium]
MITFSGIQPTGKITLGNYLGALRNYQFVDEKDQNYFCIVDLHALTTLENPTELRENTKVIAAWYIALGLHEKATIFVQSHVPGHSQLQWVLQNVARIGELNRMTQYKDKAQKKIDANSGLFSYPVLMAADILLYDTNNVPVGADQKQHIELTRDIAERFNKTYGDTFVIPEPQINQVGAKILSLTDPTKKMSKSDENPNSYITLLDTEKEITKKIKSATTDSVGVINYDPENQPGVSNLLVIHALCTNQTIEEIMPTFTDKGYGFLKQTVIESLLSAIIPIQTKFYEVLADEDFINEILAKGAATANMHATKKLREVYRNVGVYFEEI